GAVRDGQLFCYNMLAFVDSDFLEKAAQYLLQPDGRAKIKELGLRPDLISVAPSVARSMAVISLAATSRPKSTTGLPRSRRCSSSTTYNYSISIQIRWTSITSRWIRRNMATYWCR